MEWCLYTIWSPDPQDCGDPVHGYLVSTPYCLKHYKSVEWTLAHQDD